MWLQPDSVGLFLKHSLKDGAYNIMLACAFFVICILIGWSVDIRRFLLTNFFPSKIALYYRGLYPIWNHPDYSLKPYQHYKFINNIAALCLIQTQPQCALVWLFCKLNGDVGTRGFIASRNVLTELQYPNAANPVFSNMSRWPWDSISLFAYLVHDMSAPHRSCYGKAVIYLAN